MKFHKQLFRHRPEDGVIGDCHRTALACMLDKDSPEDVPHFGQTYFDSATAFHNAFETWLKSEGYCTVSIPFRAGSLAEVIYGIGDIRYLIGGQSKTGVNHTVVGFGNRIEHDPHPDEVGIIGPCDDGFFWLTFILPFHMSQVAS